MSLPQAITDMKRFTQAGFSQEITFSKRDDSQSVVVRGLVSKHNLSIDPDTGIPVNSLNSHISVVESVLIDAGYTTRNANDQIAIKGDKVSWADASGVSYTYLIDDQMPSHTLGLIVCTLGEFE